jgi:hypothetical protein
VKPVPSVRAQLDRARAALAQLEGAKNLGATEEAWKHFLWQIDRLWNKAEAHFSNSPKWGGWCGKYTKARKQDPLLKYLSQARNSDEHTIDEIAVQRQGQTTINPVVPGGLVHLKSLEWNSKGEMVVDVGSPVIIESSPARLELLDVKSRDVVYPVPHEHMGKPIPSREPQALAALGLRFYESLVVEAERFFYD